MAGVKTCSSQCRDFKCTKNALRFRGRTAWCEWTSDPCEPKGCNYATCYKRQLLDNGICGMTVKRRTREDAEPEDLLFDEIRVKGRVMRKIGDRSIF